MNKLWISLKRYDFIGHIEYPRGMQLISTTASKNIALRQAGDRSGWVYTISTRELKAFNANRAFALRGRINPFPNSQEILAIREISSKSILAAERVIRGGSFSILRQKNRFTQFFRY